MQMSVEIHKCLVEYKNNNHLDPKEWIDIQIKKWNRYFDIHRIEAVVLGVSGGIDSAVVFKLMEKTCITVHPLFLPIYNSRGIVEQDIAKQHVEELCKAKTIDLSYSAFNLINTLGIYDKWAIGQAQYLLRSPVLYSYVAKLASEKQNVRALVAGTTNRSEATLGYFGKTSDNAVDIQPIWNLWKREVYDVAEYLKVPRSIINRQPTGDTFDLKTDEENFGFPYDFLEIYEKFPKHEWYKRVLEFRQKNIHKFDEDGEPKTTAIVL